MAKVKFTPAFIARATCPNGKKRVLYSDTAMKGFVLEVRETGGKTYYLRYRDAYGSQRNYKIGDAERLSLADAREAFKRHYGSIVIGGDPQEEKRVKKAVPTLAEFVRDQYLPYVSSKRSWKSDEAFLRVHVLPTLGARRMDAITTADISKFYRGLATSGYAPASCNRIFSVVRYVFAIAIRLDVPGVTKNPAAGIPLYEVNNERQRFLTLEEVERLLNCLRRSGNEVLRNLVIFLLLTGARRAEALNAEWREFDYEHNVWTIPRSKSGKARKVQLSEAVIALLASLPSRSRSRYVFPNPETDKPYVSVYHAWDRARKEAGLADVRMHDLRHSFASFLVNSGRSLYEVQRLLGHSNISMTQRYAHLSDETLSKAVNAAASFVPVGGIVADPPKAASLPLLPAPQARYRPRPTPFEGASRS